MGNESDEEFDSAANTEERESYGRECEGEVVKEGTSAAAETSGEVATTRMTVTTGIHDWGRLPVKHSITGRELGEGRPAQFSQWLPALQHMIQLTTTDQRIGRTVRELIYRQNQLEREAWTARHAACTLYAQRTANAAKIDSILRAVTGQIGSSSVSQTCETSSSLSVTPPSCHSFSQPFDNRSATAAAHQSELHALDVKLYRQSQAWARSVTQALTELGIPFFTLAELRLSNFTPSSNQPPPPPSLIRRSKRLRRLQGQMLQFLHDMYKDSSHVHVGTSQPTTNVQDVTR